MIYLERAHEIPEAIKKEFIVKTRELISKGNLDSMTFCELIWEYVGTTTDDCDDCILDEELCSATMDSPTDHRKKYITVDLLLKRLERGIG